MSDLYDPNALRKGQLASLKPDEVLDPAHDAGEVIRQETEIIDRVRKNADRATRKVENLLDKMDDIKGQDAQIAALRAASDAQTKSIDALMKLTGRDAKPPDDDFVSVITSLANQGLARINVEIGQSQGTPHDEAPELEGG